MTKVNIQLIDAEVEPIDVLIFKKIKMGANHNVSTNTTVISKLIGTNEEEIRENYDTWKQEYLDYQPTEVALENRRKEYPSIADQLDDIYHNGIDGWKATIKITKDKYPKG